MKKALTIGWHILMASITAFLLFIVVSKIVASLANVDRGDAHWPAVQTGIVTMAVAGFAIIVCAISGSALFAGRIGTPRRIIAYILITAVLSAWIYVAYLWVNYPFQTMPTTLLGQMINFDGAIFVIILLRIKFSESQTAGSSQ